jgi:hypothetical protein
MHSVIKQNQNHHSAVPNNIENIENDTKQYESHYHAVHIIYCCGQPDNDFLLFSKTLGGCRGRDRMVVGFTTTYEISIYQL